MSPSRSSAPAPARVTAATARAALAIGARFREERARRRWSLREVARRAHLPPSVVQGVEAGRPALLETYARLADALNVQLELGLESPWRKSSAPRSDVDLVHAAMGDFEATHLSARGFLIGVDEPYQHYQFAGRADLVAWDLSARAFLHIENRTRFPDLQEAAGAWNAKRAYLAPALAERLGVRGWTSATHVMAVLWSSEAMHSLRLRTTTFRALGPNSPEAFDAWWAGAPPTSGNAATIVVLDPRSSPRQRTYCSLDDALKAKPRYRGYSEVAQRLREPSGAATPTAR